MDDIEQSNERSKKMTLAVGDLAGEFVAELIPGGAAIYKLAKILGENTREWQRQHAEDRLKEFYRQLLEDPSVVRDAVLRREMNEEDFYGVVAAVLDDEESAKAHWYVALLRGLACSSSPSPLRRFYIKAVRGLSAEEIGLLRRMVEAAGHTTEIRETEQQMQVEREVNATGSLSDVCVSSLTRWGLASANFRSNATWPTARGIELAAVLRAGDVPAK